MLKKEFIQKMKDRLAEEKKSTEKMIQKYSLPEDTMDNPDWDDLGNDATEDILEEKIVDVHEQKLERIKQALKKIEEGNYGKCEECGKIISEKRLEIEPWANYCMECQEKMV